MEAESYETKKKKSILTHCTTRLFTALAWINPVNLVSGLAEATLDKKVIAAAVTIAVAVPG